MEESKKGGINGLIAFILVIAMVRDCVRVFNEAFHLSTGQVTYVGDELSVIPYEGAYLAVGIINVLCMITLIASMFMILLEKKVGVYLFFVAQITSAVCLTYMQGDVAVHFGVALVSCILLFLLLQLRKNGISAWKAIMKK